MKFVSDFHIHSKYSRAVSQKMNLEELNAWADIKGILVLGTGDFTHPEWFSEIKQKLEPAEPGLFKLKKEYQFPNFKGKIPETRFILSVEISSIYSWNGKMRRIHNVILLPDINSAEKLNYRLSFIGNLSADGRPILGLSSKELVKITLDVCPDALIIPAHCLLPDTLIHTKNNLLKPIKEIKKGDWVITHKNKWRKVEKVFKRPYNGKVYHIKPRNFSLGLITTPEHPFYAIKTHKNCHWSNGICKPSHLNLDDCKEKYFKNYKPEWIPAEKLERGDVLIYPRFLNVFKNKKIEKINLKEIIKNNTLKTNLNEDIITPNGSKTTQIKNFISINKDFCKLAGYYLAEGYTNSRDLIGFSFSAKEKKYIKEVIDLMKKVFGFNKKPKIRKSKENNGVEILFYSKILCNVFENLFYSSEKIKNASTKKLPDWALGLPQDLQVEIFRCWWRGDSGYTTSRWLINQMKIILLRLGIVPSIYVYKKNDYNKQLKKFIKERKIKARYDVYSMRQLSFYEDKFNLLKETEFKKIAKHNKNKDKKYGWIDDNYIYLPIYDIKIKNYKGEVYNLEVEKDNSYVSEFATIHNCWTPWFSLFGSMSGFDSLKECFGEYSQNILAIETGLSSDPQMNWRIPELDSYAIVSNSDSHSLERIGREANVFETELSYNGIVNAIKNSTPKNIKENNFSEVKPPKILYTIEFFPEEGKYHYDGHRLCGVSFSPFDSKKHNNTCPKCGKPLTIGVMHRVEQLAKRPADFFDPKRPGFKKLVTLDEIIADALGIGKTSKTVWEIYKDLILNFENELNILLNVPISEIKLASNELIAEGVKRVREGKLYIFPGYDGEYGKVYIFEENERKNFSDSNTKQNTLF